MRVSFPVQGLKPTALVQAHAGASGVPGSATALVALLHAPNMLEVWVTAARLFGITHCLCKIQPSGTSQALRRLVIWDSVLHLWGLTCRLSNVKEAESAAACCSHAGDDMRITLSRYHLLNLTQGAYEAWLQVASLGDSGFRLMRGGQCAFASEVRWMQEKCFLRGVL